MLVLVVGVIVSLVYITFQTWKGQKDSYMVTLNAGRVSNTASLAPILVTFLHKPYL